jgi:long-chain acyl-CoA synthetase
MAAKPIDTIPRRLMQQAQQRPHAPAYHAKQGGAWRSTSWKVYAGEVRRAARALMALGLEPGGKVAQLGFNSPTWTIFHLGAMCAGGAGAGVYTTCSAEEVQYIVHHAEALAVLIDSVEQWEKIKAQREALPLLRRVITTRGVPRIDDPLVSSWEEFEALADEVSEERLDQRIDGLGADDVATIIYTSGTTGPPKGVMLSHANLAWTARKALELIGTTEGDCGLSYLPLSHIAEQMLTIHVPATIGAAIYYAESLAKVADNLREVQPTIVFGVPRIWEKIHATVSAKLAEVTGPKKALIEWARRTATRVNELGNRGRSPGPALAVQYRLAHKLVLGKLKQALGLSRARMCVSGAAPIGREILEFFASLDIVIHEIYGQSEDCGPTTFNGIGKTKFGSVGTRIPGIEVKIADDGEILVRGPNVFLGYYKEEAATAEALSDGWLCSGDLGVFDDEGFLSITGRKKEIIITAGGKNIAPKNIEAALKNSELIGEAVVIGDRRKYLTALITLDEDAVGRFLGQRGLAAAPVDQIPEIGAAVQKIVDEVNTHLARVETIKKFTILPKPFSIDHGELTPTLKLKRKVISERYQQQIDAMYAAGSSPGSSAGSSPGSSANASAMASED